MEIRFIGTGDCAGIPVYNCNCAVCTESRTNPARRRNQSCAHLTASGLSLLIDAGPADIGERFTRDAIDFILLSHYHIDHVYGLFPLRWGRAAEPLPVYGPDNPEGCADLLKHPGVLDFSIVLHPFAVRRVGDLEITPLPLNHSTPSLGYALAVGASRLAWLCDTGGLPPETREFLKGWQPQLMVLDCTFPPLGKSHPNHNDIHTALALHGEIGPQRTCLTHIGHDLDRWLADSGFILPEGVQSAVDGLSLRF